MSMTLAQLTARDKSALNAVIFDLDGVVTRTAGLHAAAWKQLFDDYLGRRAAQQGEPFRPFDAEGDYQRFVDGKPRYEGVRSFLESRGIALPYGDPADPSEAETVCGLGNRKNAIFQELLAQGGVEVFKSSVAFIRHLQARGVRVALVSSSKNTTAVLESAGLSDLFEVRVDGVEAARLGLGGKPHPETFLEAAQRLGVDPARAAVVEDAIAGVAAGRAGGFGLVIGVARAGDGAALRANGADIVVGDLAELCDGAKLRPGAAALPNALARAAEIRARLAGKRPAVFLDYDGTLTPIVARPELAVLSDATRAVVRALAERCTVAIVSGRDRAEVERLVGLDGLVYAGSHGFDIAGPGGLRKEHECAAEFLPALDRAEERLRRELAGAAGALVERKKFAIAVHYRLVAEDEVPRVDAAVATVAAETPELRRTTGKKVFELRPRLDWDKGKAVLWLLAALGLDHEDVLPLYLGDDDTDEDAFAALANRGIGILIAEAPQPTVAHYVLSDTEEAARFLGELAAMLDGATDWTLRYDGFEPDREGLREALCTLGNGYFATRGAAEEAEADDIHYPGTYLAGGYNRIETEIAGRVIENEDLVNLPNWLPLSFRPEGGDWLNLLAAEILSYRQELDLKQGVLRRAMRVRDRQGRETTLVGRRIVHMGAPHLAAIEWTLTPENWSGRIEVLSALDGRVINAGVPRYRQLNGKHLVPLEAREIGGDGILLIVETSQSHIRIAQAARTNVFAGGGPVEAERQIRQEEGYIAHALSFAVAEGQSVAVEKVVALHTSRDRAMSEPGIAAEQTLHAAGRFGALLAGHVLAWSHLWRRCDLVLEGHPRTQMILRLHVFHLLQTVSFNTVELDAGVPARGLHGEAYRGHIFWDELFIFPFLNLRIPELTRALLRYRHRRLPAARQLARAAGYRGAMYPWQSGSDGREETQILHLNPKSGRWLPDNTHLQRHVNAAIAYNVWRYYEATEDREFLAFYGAEMLFEIARFWASIAAFNPERGRYEIRGVMGPDEFHDRYPWAEAPGLDNNAYTNVMAAWVLLRALDARTLLDPERRAELDETLALGPQEIARWEEISRTMFVPFHDGVMSQFEGYERLEEFDWAGYREKYGDIHRLDRILEAEGDTVNRYKASKQADALMLFYLFSSEELGSLFARLGFPFDPDLIPRTVEYYLQRTSNGSTLSGIVHSWVLARSDRARSWALLKQALESDIADVQGGTTPEGIHLGAMAGTVDLVQRGQTGLEIRGDVLRLNPCLPQELKGLRFRIRYRQYWLQIDIGCERMIVSAIDGWAGPDRITVRDETYPFGAGARLDIPCHLEDGGWRPQRGPASLAGESQVEV